MTVTTGTLLAPFTTLRLGGPAGRLVTVTTSDELVATLTELDAAGEPVLLLAGGSNVVLPDAGFPGTVVRIATTGVWSSPGRDDDSLTLRVDAGVPWDAVVSRAVDSGLTGVECLSGIPGSTGATPVQNVGAYGQEVAETIVAVEVLDRQTGERLTLSPDECGFGYRRSRFKYQDRLVVLQVVFRLERSELSRPIRYAELARHLGIAVGERAPTHYVRLAVLELRRSKGMVVDETDPDTMSAGSFFTNPVLSAAAYDELVARAGTEVPRFVADDGIKVPAAWLIERAGFTKGYRVEGAGISTKHTLALVNRGGTTADLLALARAVRDAVRERFGVELHPEPVIVGGTL